MRKGYSCSPVKKELSNAAMNVFIELVRDLSLSQFHTIFAASTRAARQMYLQRHKVKPKSAPIIATVEGKMHRSVDLLYARLQEVEDAELCEEILRTYLLTEVSLLSSALDFLAIPHEKGVTDSDEVHQIAQLEGEALRALYAHCLVGHKDWQVQTYLRFMGVPKAVLNKELSPMHG
jgi:hypothetical protein